MSSRISGQLPILPRATVSRSEIWEQRCPQPSAPIGPMTKWFGSVLRRHSRPLLAGRITSPFRFKYVLRLGTGLRVLIRRFYKTRWWPWAISITPSPASKLRGTQPSSNRRRWLPMATGNTCPAARTTQATLPGISVSASSTRMTKRILAVVLRTRLCSSFSSSPEADLAPSSVPSL